jgi:siroheme synthase-like protein
VSYYPVALDLRGRGVVVVGGGEEAAAKVARLLASGACLRVISPTAVPAIRDLAAAGEILWLVRRYRPGDLRGARLAIVCEPEAAAAVREEAEAANCLVNVVDWPAACDFLAVAHFDCEGLQVAVHTSGQSAALSRRLRERLQHRIGQPYGQLARVLGELRPVVRALIPNAAARRDFWLERVSPGLLEQVEAGGFAPEPFRAEVLARAGAAAP